MAYKKYIVKNGKTYGPYVYQSRRVNGKVISEYKGIDEGKVKKNTLPIVFASIIIVVLALGLFFFLNQSITGKAILKIEGKVIDGKLENGKMNIEVNEGELIPSDSLISFENNGSAYVYNLSDLLKGEETVSGNFYLQNSGISGNGEGYGFVGKKEIFPEISFELQPSNVSQSGEENESGSSGGETPSGNEGEENNSVSNPPLENETETETPPESNETLPEENPEVNPEETQNPSEEIPEGTEELTPEENTEEQVEVATEETTEEETANPAKTPSENSPVTGGIIGAITGFFTGFGVNEENSLVISGIVSKGNDFTADSKGIAWEVVPGSVKAGNESLPDNTITNENSEGSVIVKTDYSIKEEGYGREYLGKNAKEFIIPLSKLGVLSEGPLTVKLNYEGKEVTLFKGEISKETVENELENITQIFNETITSNFSFSENLTQFERQILLFNTNESNVKTIVSKYKDKYLVSFTLGPYSAEYSYPQRLTDDELKAYIERNKYLWLKDIVAQIGEKTPAKETIEELGGELEF